MKGKKLFQAMRNIDPQLILDAAPSEKSRASRAWIRWESLAACLCLVATALFLFLPNSPVSLFPHTHLFGEWQSVKDATCATHGEEIRVCACGETEIRYTALLPHFAGEWVVEKEPTIKLPTPDDPDEREPGLKCQFCERCGAKLNEEIIPATGSLGLAYAMNPDGKTFSVAGIGNCTDEDILIPENFCGYHVTAVSQNAFSGCEQIKSISFPETITVIGERAFYECRSIETITLPKNLVEIGAGAFSCCRLLKEIVVPSGVTHIGKGAFSDIFYLETVVLPQGLDCISEYLFQGSLNLKNITLPEGITSIGAYAFQRCSSLKSINIPASVTSIGGAAFENCDSITSIVLPEGIETIMWNTFSYCRKLVSVTIPESVTSIGNWAFYQCRLLKDIRIPSGVTIIGNNAFEECSSLTSLVLPEGLVGIEGGAFSRCSKLREINIPDSVKYIGEDAFYRCEYLFQVENNVFYVDNWVVEFQYGFEEAVLREGTVGIARWAFDMPGVLARVTIPSSLKYIGEYVFSYSSCLKEIIFDGTEEQWNAIEKEEYWNRYLEDIEIIFTKTSNE